MLHSKVCGNWSTGSRKEDFVRFLHSKSLKKCHTNFEKLLTNNYVTPKNDLDHAFCMCKECKFKVFQ